VQVKGLLLLVVVGLVQGWEGKALAALELPAEPLLP